MRFCFSVVEDFSISSFNFLPVDNLPDFGQKLWSKVLVVKIISMFPDIDGYNKKKMFSFEIEIKEDFVLVIYF